MQNSSVSMSKVTQVGSTTLQWGYKCFWLQSQKAIDSRCSALWVRVLLDFCTSCAHLLVWLRTREQSSRRGWCSVVVVVHSEKSEGVAAAQLSHPFRLLICRHQPRTTLDGGVYFQKGAELPMHISTKNQKQCSSFQILIFLCNRIAPTLH